VSPGGDVTSGVVLRCAALALLDGPPSKERGHRNEERLEVRLGLEVAGTGCARLLVSMIMC
jgi:hypothetical protein